MVKRGTLSPKKKKSMASCPLIDMCRAGQGPVARPNPEKTEKKNWSEWVNSGPRVKRVTNTGTQGYQRAKAGRGTSPAGTRTRPLLRSYIYRRKHETLIFFSFTHASHSLLAALSSLPPTTTNTNDHLHLFFFLNSLSYLTHKTLTQTKRKKSTSIDLHPSSSLSLLQIMKYCMSRSERY